MEKDMGWIASLTPEQRQRALAYTGPARRVVPYSRS